MNNLAGYGATVGRILLAAIFVIAGYGKIFGYAAAQGYMEKFGVPGLLLPLVIITELGGGLALVAGWQTRVVAFLLAGFTLLATVIFHNDFADRIQFLFFLKNLAIAGGLLVLVSHGPGPLAVDNRRT
ncbi:MAG: DoxX family protein [Methyloligellaceae bacterium]